MELKRLNIYANDRKEPTIIVTYITKESKKRELEAFKVWLRKDKACDYEIINYANKLFYQVKVHTKKPTEKDIFRVYQELFSDKLWENYKETQDFIFDKVAINIPPQVDYVELDKDYMRNFVEEYTIEYIKEVNKKTKSKK